MDDIDSSGGDHSREAFMELTLLQLRMTSLERRVRRIEDTLDLKPESPNAPPPPPEPVMRQTVSPPVPQPKPQLRPTVAVPPPIPTAEPAITRPTMGAARPALAPLSASPVISYAPKVAPISAPRGEIEQTIGLKWAGWIGAIVLVIGAGLGIKFAVDNGWLQVLPPALRLGLMYLGGFALIGAGEWVYRRVNDIASAGIFAAGVATLFLVSYAGHGMYGLYARDTAFILMGVSTLVGAAVAIRGKLVSVATLSLIGGNIAPMLLHSDHPHLVPFLCYLLMLQLVALVLAWWGGSKKWWMLRALSLASTSFWMAWLIAQPSAVASPSTQIFLLIFAGLFQAEVIVSTAKRIKQPLDIKDAPAQPGVIFSVLVTAALTAGTFFLLREQTNTVRGIWTLVFAAITLATAFALPRNKFPSLKAIAAGYGLQSAMLLIAAVPMLFTGSGIVFGWAILACGFAALGAAMDLDVARQAAVLVWCLGATYLVKCAHSSTGTETWLTLFGTAIPAYLFVAASLTFAANIIAILTSARQSHSSSVTTSAHLEEVLSALGGIVWVVAAMSALPTLGATLAFVAYAWLLFAVDLVRPRHGFIHQSAIVLVLATLKWIVLDNLADRIAPGWSAARYTPVLNPVMGLGVLISASLAAIVWFRRSAFLALVKQDAPDDDDRSRLMLLVASFVLVFMTIGFSFEIDRIVEQVRASTMLAWPPDQAKHLAWTMLWIASLSGIIGLARLLESSPTRRRETMRKLSVFPMLLAIKFMIIDTLGYRMTGHPANVLIVANLQTLAAMFVLGGLALAWYVGGPHEGETTNARRPFIGFLAIALIFLTGSIEIDRWAAYQKFGNPWFVRQVGFSIFWSVFGVACVACGFRTRVAALRYCGLGLLAITLAKVVLVDLGQISTGYRVLSFMGLGLLLLGTSVLYGKLSPRLLAIGDASGDSVT
jgi:uncharacterized membrane protein